MIVNILKHKPRHRLDAAMTPLTKVS